MTGKTKIVYKLYEWDSLVNDIYGKPYSFQQQDGCKSRGTYSFTVPDDCTDDYDNDTIPETFDTSVMGVSFKAWLKRDPKQPVGNCTNNSFIELWWERNFYPDIQMISNDLYFKKLLDAGDYLINIDW